MTINNKSTKGEDNKSEKQITKQTRTLTVGSTFGTFLFLIKTLPFSCLEQ